MAWCRADGWSPRWVPNRSWQMERLRRPSALSAMRVAGSGPCFRHGGGSMVALPTRWTHGQKRSSNRLPKRPAVRRCSRRTSRGIRFRPGRCRLKICGPHRWDCSFTPSSDCGTGIAVRSCLRIQRLGIGSDPNTRRRDQALATLAMNVWTSLARKRARSKRLVLTGLLSTAAAPISRLKTASKAAWHRAALRETPVPSGEPTGTVQPSFSFIWQLIHKIVTQHPRIVGIASSKPV